MSILKLIITFAIMSLLVGCSAIAEHQATARHQVYPTGVLTRDIIVTYLDNVQAKCGPYQACAIGSRIYMQKTEGWEGTEPYRLEWDFSGTFVSMDGNRITGRAWPSNEDLAVVLAPALGLPETDYQYHRLLAHEIKHVFGMVHR